MHSVMTSRKRMLMAIECAEPDYAPCSFMLFSALRRRCDSCEQFIRRQVELGLDTIVPISIPQRPCSYVGANASPMHPPPQPVPQLQVQVRQWREQRTDGLDILHKEWLTPDGTLTTEVRLTRDWADLQDVPLFGDYLVPRAQKFPVGERKDLAALRYVLGQPTPEDVWQFGAELTAAKELAAELGLLVQVGEGFGIEAAAWLCGMEQMIFHAVDHPEMLDELAQILYEWNIEWMKAVLEPGVDLFVRRGWYEGTDFWSPPMYERFIFPYLKREVELTHEAGAKFGYIHTSGTMGVLDYILEAGVDVLIGVDPVQGDHTDMKAMRERVGDKMALWGGVNGPLTVEQGTPEQIRDAVKEAIKLLGPCGFILSPVDNISDESDETMERVHILIKAWRETW